MVRHNNLLPNNLPQLQNLFKRDPESYKDDFHQQYRHFLSSLEVFALKPTEKNKSLNELVMFIVQVAQCYPVRRTKCLGESSYGDEMAGRLEEMFKLTEPKQNLLDLLLRII